MARDFPPPLGGEAAFGVIKALERLISCGRSSKYGFRRRGVMRATARADQALAIGPRDPWPLLLRAVGRLSFLARSQYRLQPGGISRAARSSAARNAARGALSDARKAIGLSPSCALAYVVAALACEDLQDKAGALRLLDRALALEPREGWIYQFRSDVRRRAGDIKGFVADCEAAILLDEGAAYFRFAAGDVESRSPARIIRAADRWLKAHPHDYWMHVFRADRLRSPEINDFAGAMAGFERAVELKPDCAYAWAYLSRARMTNATGPEALAAIDRAIKLSPRCGWFHVWRGEVRRRTGQVKESLADFDRGLELDPNYEFGYAWRGGAKRALGSAKEALGDLELACALDPSYAWSFAERSLALRGIGRVGEALKSLEQARRLDPKYVWCSDLRKAEEALAELEAYLKENPSDAAAWAWRGQIKLERGDLRGALEDLSAALRLEPAHSWARAWRGRAQALLGRGTAALSDLDQAVRLDARNAYAFAWRAEALSARGKERAAVRDLGRAASLAPKEAWIWQQKGLAEERLGRWSSAAADYGRAIELDRRHPGLRAGRARAWLKTGRRAAADGDLAVILDAARERAGEGDHRAAAELCTEALLGDPRCVAALEIRSEAWRCCGEYERAVADKNMLARLFPRDARRLLSRGVAKRTAWDFKGALADARAAYKMAQGRLPSACVLQSEALRNLGRWQEAVDAATAAVTARPDDAWSLVVRAKAQRQSGSLSLALSDADAAVRLDPKDAKAHGWRGEILRAQGRRREALSSLRRACALDPSCAWALALRGEVRRELGDARGGVADVKTAVKLDPRCCCAYDFLGDEPAEVRTDRRHAWVYAWRAAARRSAGASQEAGRDFDRAVRLDPSCLWARAWRGELRLSQEEYKGALLDIDAALRRRTEKGEWLVWKGRALCGLKRCAAAGRAFASALRADPGNVWALIGAGVCRERSGDPRRAVAYLEKARKIAPGLFSGSGLP